MERAKNMTRDEAIFIAKMEAYKEANKHSYIPESMNEFTGWQPHEWVIQAILKAANGY